MSLSDLSSKIVNYLQVCARNLNPPVEPLNLTYVDLYNRAIDKKPRTPEQTRSDINEAIRARTALASSMISCPASSAPLIPGIPNHFGSVIDVCYMRELGFIDTLIAHDKAYLAKASPTIQDKHKSDLVEAYDELTELYSTESLPH